MYTTSAPATCSTGLCTITTRQRRTVIGLGSPRTPDALLATFTGGSECVLIAVIPGCPTAGPTVTTVLSAEGSAATSTSATTGRHEDSADAFQSRIASTTSSVTFVLLA